MSTRIHLVLAEAEKALYEQAARKEGLTLSAWLREAASEKLARDIPPTLTSMEALTAFFKECKDREEGLEPDWDAHRKVIEASRLNGVPDP
jgi:hypothetical protein